MVSNPIIKLGFAYYIELYLYCMIHPHLLRDDVSVGLVCRCGLIKKSGVFCNAFTLDQAGMPSAKCGALWSGSSLETCEYPI